MTNWLAGHFHKTFLISSPPCDCLLCMCRVQRRKEENRTIFCLLQEKWWNCHPQHSKTERPAVLESPLQLEYVLFLKAQLQTAKWLLALFRLIRELFFSALLELRCWSCFSHLTSEVLQYSVVYTSRAIITARPCPPLSLLLLWAKIDKYFIYFCQ